ncbi:MAG: ABC transporter ATP-binding protein [Candidatus Nanopelagicales bacterium]|nr:ABC transporter ATP-binding protein [Candidatus Nanopelagicales bacterium]MCF8537338.1 ABC transporter ATP-binding protein [Candidatus Nanopelagicales bacterium]MCF8542201.1 ABC transporter ATP-binding protein [Candidatus Nanopelagicales bacterium]MCF8557341.1 ABC transporter ATP-binding protein [Candidatus Nanopelagicales bacterium]
MGYYAPFPHPAVALEDVSVRLGGLQILDSVSIAAPRGAVTGLIGPNGAGKTTVFNVMSGFVPADSGSVVLNGQHVHHVRPQQLTRRGVARTLQGVGLFPSLTVLDNVMMGAPTRFGVIADALAMPWVDRERRQMEERAREALVSLGIEGESSRLPSELPYPVQKRVALARALVSDPSVLLLDEPAGGIGEADMQDLERLIRSSVPDRTVVLVEHHMELVMAVCDFIWVLDAGQVIASGTPDQIRSDPAVLAAYLGEEGAA